MYSTPVGRFLYRPVPERVFWMGVTRSEAAPGRGFLIATREKALADTLMRARRIGTVTRRRIETLLFDDLRCAAEDLASFDVTIIDELARQCRRRACPPWRRHSRTPGSPTVNEVVSQMLGRYPLDSLGDRLRALREVLQQLALLGLWRARFYEHAAFYGGTALRVVHGLDRFSEDLDFSLLASDGAFGLDR